jgi:hypothetical protein
MLTYYALRRKAFDENLTQNKQCVWLKLPDPNIFITPEYKPMPTLDWFHGLSLDLTKTEYVAHITHLIHLLKTEKQFHLHLSETEISNDAIIIVKKDIGVIVCKAHEHPVYFALNHPTMVNAFQTFIDGISDCKHSETPSKSHVIEHLENWVSFVEDKHHSN